MTKGRMIGFDLKECSSFVTIDSGLLKIYYNGRLDLYEFLISHSSAKDLITFSRRIMIVGSFRRELLYQF